MLRRILVITLLFGCLTNVSNADNIFDKVSQWKEEKLLEQLASVQENPESELAAFKTDGCSGGLSQAWLWMAETFPEFKLKYNNDPPWQQCCVDHDRLYWQGIAKDGFSLRKQADRELQKCVIETGKAKSLALPKDSDLNRMLFEKAFEQVALQMYIAVRIGGGPCTLFPWRWGYGWPHCPLPGIKNEEH